MRHCLVRLGTSFLTFFLGLTAATVWRSAPKPTKTSSPPPIVREQSGLSLVPLYSTSEYQNPHDFFDIAFLPNGQMWGCGFNGHNFGNLWHSTDGGRYWESVSTPPSAYSLHHLQFADQLHGWAAGGRNVIIRTTDGGETWGAVKLREKITGGITFNFINPHVGYVAAETGYSLMPHSDERTFGIIILRTNDGGQTWHKVYEDDESGNVHMITALSEQVVLAAIDGTHILRSVDGGRMWKTINLPSGGVSSIRAGADGSIWAVGHGGGFYRSTDQGNSWQRPANFPPSLAKRTWWDIGFIDSRLGLAVGDHGAFAATNDGGNTWADAPVNVDDHLRGIRLFGRGGLVRGALNVYRLTVGDTR